MTYLLYGLRDGQERYEETLLLGNGRSMANIEKVKIIASKDGWGGFRVATYSDEQPDFGNVLTTD